jgi:geranylgeranyl pyrophosphate synthase
MEQKTATFFDLTQLALLEVEAAMRTSPDERHPNLDVAIDQLITSGGKRIRPRTVILIGEMLGGNQSRIITHAAAIELLHTATLVHDDLVDGSLLRRGTPTINSKWGPDATVLAGDYIFARAAYLAAKTGSLPLMESFAKTLMVIANGEFTQLFDINTQNLRETYIDHIYAKTASLFEVAAEGAALLSRSDAGTIESMKSFGRNIGLAFQIVDDVLDFSGVQEDIGKPVASDLRQGVITLPAVYYFEERNTSSAYIKKVCELEIGEDEKLDLIEDIRGSDGIDRAIEDAEGYVKSAIRNLEDMPRVQAQRALIELAEFITQRSA